LPLTGLHFKCHGVFAVENGESNSLDPPQPARAQSSTAPHTPVVQFETIRSRQQLSELACSAVAYCRPQVLIVSSTSQQFRNGPHTRTAMTVNRREKTLQVCAVGSRER
jgi:hypothetical protein